MAFLDKFCSSALGTKQKKNNTNVAINNLLLLTLRVGNKTLKGIAILKLTEIGKCKRTSPVELLKRD